MVICGTDLLSSISPYVHILSSSSSSTYCSQCLNLSTDLKRCSKCHLVSYCSISCQRKDWIYHKHECSHLQTINNEYDLTRFFLRLVLRYQKDNGIDSAHTKRSFNDLETHENDIRHDRRRFLTFQFIHQYLVSSNICPQLNERDLFELFCRLVINTLTIHDPIDLKPIGYGLYLDATKYNHSCLPTCQTLFNGLYLTVRTIGELTTDEWTINYIDLLYPFNVRQETLRENYYFNCQCKRCLKNDPNEIVALGKLRHEEEQMDEFIQQNDFVKAYQSSKRLSSYYDEILPYYHAYLSLHHVKQLKLELFLAETLSEGAIQAAMKSTWQRLQISMGEKHPLAQETRHLCEQYQLEMAFKHKQITD